MTVTRQGIPTTYSEANFRSMLEARWAAFFDLIGWPWIYEPMEGNGYIPDFLIPGDLPLLIEVKPLTTVEELEPVALDAWYRMEGRFARVLAVGVSPTLGISLEGCTDSTRRAGSLAVGQEGEGEPYSDEAVWSTCGGAGHMSDGKWVPDPAHEGWTIQEVLMSFRNSPCGCHCKPYGLRYDMTGLDIENELQRLWRKAGSMTQWNPRRSR